MDLFRRPMLPALLAFVAGLVACRQLLPLAPPILALLLVGGAGAAWTVARRFGNSTALFLVAMMGAGVVRMLPSIADEARATSLLSQIPPNQPRVIAGQVVAAEYDDRLQDLRRLMLARVTVTSGSQRLHIPGKVSVLVQRGENEPTADVRSFTPGTLVRALGTISAPDSYYNFFGQTRSDFLAMRRTYATARVRSTTLIETEGASAELAPAIRTSLLRARKAADRILTAALPDHEGRLFRSMLFSDLRLLDDTDLRIFRDSGTMHLFAVSGMHVAILAFVLNGIFRGLRMGARRSWILVLILLFAYVWLLDFIAPALRAFLMVTAYVSGRILQREVDPMSALLFGATAILLVEPLALWSAGFQLSVVGVASIVLLVPVLRQWIRVSEADNPADALDGRHNWVALMGNGGADIVCVTLAVTIGLVPLQFYLFHQFNVLAPLTNLFEAMLAGPVLSAGLAVLAMGSIAPELAAYIGHGTALLMQAVYHIAAVTADQQWALLHLRQMPAFLMVLCYAVLAGGYYMVWVYRPEFQLKSRARLTVHATACVSLLVCYAAWNQAVRPLRIWFLDVGQGDATLLQLPSGQSLLIDAGHALPDLGRLVVLPQLRGAGVWPLHGIIATHSDADHTGGIPSVLAQHRVEQYFTSDARQNPDTITERIYTICDEKNIPRTILRAGEVIEPTRGLKLEVLNPPSSDKQNHNNNESVVLRLTYGGFTALLMADAESEVEERLVEEGRVGPVTLLKAGHHGSKTSSTWAFVKAVKPELAVVSCGRNNRFGHPDAGVVRRLEAAGATLLRTDLQGAVLIETNGRSYKVRTARQ